MWLCSPALFTKAVTKLPKAALGFKVARALWDGLRTDVKVKEGGHPEEVVSLPWARTLLLSFHRVSRASLGASFLGSLHGLGEHLRKIENQRIFCFSSEAEFKHECNVLGKQTFQASCLNLSKGRYLQIYQAGMNYPQCSKHFLSFLKANKHNLKAKQNKKNNRPASVGWRVLPHGCQGV